MDVSGQYVGSIFDSQIVQEEFTCNAYYDEVLYKSERSLNSGNVCYDSVQRTLSSKLLSKLFCTVVKSGLLLSNQDINCRFLEEKCCKRTRTKG